MQITLQEIKRKIICPNLGKQGWDYDSANKDDKFFNFCIREIMAWYYRRGRATPYEVLCPLVSYLGKSKGIDFIKISKMQAALRRFTIHGLYSKIEAPIIDAEAQLVIDNIVIKYNIPVLTLMKGRLCIVFSDQNITSREDLKDMYETRFCSVWGFYSLNKYPTFYNLYRDDEKIKHIKFTPNQFYIRDNKKFFNNMEDKVLETKIYPAPIEICRNCNRRAECQLIKLRLKKRSKIGQ